jgi:pimeloyl-ACP methyl ester carboxylesterase
MNIADYTKPLVIDGMHGRVVHIAASKKGQPEIVFVYGHHSSLERWWGISQAFAPFGAVTMPDLPGFGSMDSLYKIGKTASINNLADYLAAFMRQRYDDGRKAILVGMSSGFVIITRMLQRHPDLTKNVSKLISLFGFAHKDDFRLTPKARVLSYIFSRTFSLPVLAEFYRATALSPFVLRRTYHRTHNAREKFKDATPEQHKKLMDFEIKLWHQNDLRTQMYTGLEFLRLDNTKVKISLPVYHIAVKGDRFLNNASVAKHMRHIFSDFNVVAELQNGTHAPTMVSTAEEAAGLITPELTALIRKQ